MELTPTEILQLISQQVTNMGQRDTLGFENLLFWRDRRRNLSRPPRCCSPGASSRSLT